MTQRKGSEEAKHTEETKSRLTTGLFRRALGPSGFSQVFSAALSALHPAVQ